MENLKKGLRKADKVFRSFKEKNSTEKNRQIIVSQPVQQSTTSTSALLPESVQQLNDCYKRCSASTVFLKRLIETKRYELVSEAVTDIFKQTSVMMESINRRDNNFSSEWMAQNQQLARTYLATLVKLSDRLSVNSSRDEIDHASKMVDQLVETLSDISTQAQSLMPQTLECEFEQNLSLQEPKSAVPRSILRRSVHNSMEDLTREPVTLPQSGLTRVSVRRSFRTIKRKISSRSNVRQHQSTDRLVSRRREHIERRHCLSGELGEHLDVVDGAPARISTSSSGIRAASLGSKSTDSMLVENSNTWSSRPPSAASCDMLSNSSTTNIITDLTTLETKPPIPPKSRPLGGMYIFNNSVLKRNSLMSIESTDSTVEQPPELPLKVSPTKSHRDSGYEIEVRKSIDLQEISENARPLELLDLILSGSKLEKDLLEIFLSSYRTFMSINKLIDALLKRIRQTDTCLKNNALHLLIRVIGEKSYSFV